MTTSDIQIGKRYIARNIGFAMPGYSSVRTIEEVIISKLSKTKNYAMCEEYLFWFPVSCILDEVE